MLAKAVYEGICIGNLDYIRILLMIDNYTNLWMCYNYAYLFYILYFTIFLNLNIWNMGKQITILFFMLLWSIAVSMG